MEVPLASLPPRVVLELLQSGTSSLGPETVEQLHRLLQEKKASERRERARRRRRRQRRGAKQVCGNTQLVLDKLGGQSVDLKEVRKRAP